jgi:hypothetical protein
MAAVLSVFQRCLRIAPRAATISAGTNRPAKTAKVSGSLDVGCGSGLAARSICLRGGGGCGLGLGGGGVGDALGSGW